MMKFAETAAIRQEKVDMLELEEEAKFVSVREARTAALVQDLCVKTRNFVLKTKSFVLKTRSCVLKPRDFVLENEELCIKNEELCVKTEGFCARKRETLC